MQAKSLELGGPFRGSRFLPFFGELFAAFFVVLSFSLSLPSPLVSWGKELQCLEHLKSSTCLLSLKNILFAIFFQAEKRYSSCCLFHSGRSQFITGKRGSRTGEICLSLARFSETNLFLLHSHASYKLPAGRKSQGSLTCVEIV